MNKLRVKRYECFGYKFEFIDGELYEVMNGDKTYHKQHTGMWDIRLEFSAFADITIPQITPDIVIDWRGDAVNESYTIPSYMFNDSSNRLQCISNCSSFGLTGSEIIQVLDGCIHDKLFILGKDHYLSATIFAVDNGDFGGYERYEQNGVNYYHKLMHTENISIRLTINLTAYNMPSIFWLYITGKCQNFYDQLVRIDEAFNKLVVSRE
jgi:hypothetical protein